MSDTTRAQLLGISPGDTVWILGHSDEENSLLDGVSSDIEIVDDQDHRPEDPDEDGADRSEEFDEDFEPSAAIVVVDDAVSLPDDLDEALPRVSGIDIVWVAIPRRSRGVDPAAVEAIVADYGWTAGARVDLDDTWTAVRVELS